MAITTVTAEMLALINGAQKKNGAGSLTLENNPVFAHLVKHGTINSQNPLLAQVNPKYPTDAVWSGLAVARRKELAEQGYYITSAGKKPTVYTLRKVSDLVAANKPTPAVTAPAVTAPAKN